MFEYLMPLLRDAQLSRTRCSTSRAGWSCAARSSTAPTRGVPWGISESAYNVVDRHDTYQYKAFGVPGLGLKRGLGDELVVAPYATALAVDDRSRRERGQPAAADRGRPRRRLRILRRHRLHRARADTPTSRRPTRAAPRTAPSSAPTSRTTQGMTLVALANALLGDRDGRALSRRSARAGDRAAAAGARAAPHADDRTAAARRDARRRAAAGDAGAPLSIAAHRRARTRSSCRTATTSPS